MRLPGQVNPAGRVWSEQQQAIFKAFREPAGNVLVRARAGCAKTTTSLEGVKQAPERRILVAAFNKLIADEANARLVGQDRVKAKTLHALGMGYIKSAWGPVEVDNNGRGWELVNSYTTASQEIKTALKATHTKVRELNPWADTAEDIERIAVTYDLLPGDEAWVKGWNEGLFYDAVLEILKAAEEYSEVVDFADMIFLPLRKGMVYPSYELVVVDEAQDMTRPQLEIAKRATVKDGRMFIVGDDRQCHPAGTMIQRTGKDSTVIENLAEGEELVTYHECFRGRDRQGRKIEHIHKQAYTGLLLHLNAYMGGPQVTPNHRIPTRIDATKGGYVVYLMESGETSRIGTCRASYTNGFGLTARVKHERAERAWVLKWFQEKNEALVYETVTALRYGLPENIFFEKGKLRQQLVMTIGSNRKAAVACLADHGRVYTYPLVEKGRLTHIGRKLYITEACNLIAGVNQVRTYDGTKDGGGWIPVVLTTRQYSGDIYGLQVEPTEGGNRLYIADGVVVHNSIYGFRGADSGALDRLKEQLNAVELGLKTTYRCGRAIVERAREYVPDFEAAPTVEEGVVRNCLPSEMIETATPGDFVLSRVNAPLMGVALGLIRRGVRARIRGREIGKGLVDIIKKLRVTTLADLDEALERYRGKEIGKLSKRDPHLARTKIAQLQDNIDTIATLAETVASVDELTRKLDMLFNDEAGAASVMCSTVHKAKGLEADRVWILEDTLKRGGQEELNICYVAYTRARKELCLVSINKPMEELEEVTHEQVDLGN
jgi:superfamily I DNA/RNA helicase